MSTYIITINKRFYTLDKNIYKGVLSVWDIKYDKLEDLLKYIEEYEKYKYFKLSESCKQNCENIKDFANKVVPINLMKPNSFANEDSVVEFKIKESFEDYIEINKKYFLGQIEYIKYLGRKEYFHLTSKFDKKLIELRCRKMFVEILSKTFCSCKKEYILEVIKIVDNWYKEEEWFDYVDNNKLLYYGATLYYSLLHNGNIALDDEGYDLKIKKELENTYFKCISPLKMNQEFSSLFEDEETGISNEREIYNLRYVGNLTEDNERN